MTATEWGQLDPELQRIEVPARIKFGPKAHQDMPAEWAEKGLTWLKAERPKVFGDMMLVIVEVERGRS